MTHDDLVERIAARFCAPEWAFLTDVRNTTGFRNFSGTADALALNLWPNRGMELHGFEAKASREDWLREMKKPDKAESICQYCDCWWLVVSDVSFVREGELPRPWGMMIPFSKTLKIVKHATRLKAKPISRGFLGAMLRSATSGVFTKEQVNIAVSEAEEAVRKDAPEMIKRKRETAARALRTIREFQKASGIMIRHGDVDGKRLGRAAKFLAEHGVDSILRDLEWAKDRLFNAHERMEDQLKEVNGRLKRSGLKIEED